MSNNKTFRNLEQISRTLVHDIATPLATMQLNLQALTTYLPRLIEVYRQSNGDSPPINPDHLVALARLPSALENDIQKLRELTQTFLGAIAPTSAVSSTAVPLHQSKSGSTRSIQRLLLVEDEEIHQQIALKQLGGNYPVDIAGTGAEALRLCGENAYDLVLLDFLLPGMDGRSLISALRRLLPQGAAIIALSNMPMQNSDYDELDIQGFLAKPFRLQNLEDWIIARAAAEEKQS